MRKSLNDNPLVAIGVVALLGIGVAFLMLGQVSKKSSSETTPTTTAPAAGATAATAPGVSAATATPATAAAAPTVALGAFVAGPGLPKPVVDAYERGDVVALLVLKANGIDDRAVGKAVKLIGRAPNVAVFQTFAQDVARYSRIAEGVDLNRVPALVVMRPRKLSKGAPTATVAYGFTSPQSIAQAFRDAAYRGPADLPFSPR
jgi:hypothetical protein